MMSQNDPAPVLRNRFSPLRNGILAGGLLLFTTGVTLLNYHQLMTRDAKDAMQNSLRRTALACALTVDPRWHRLLTNPEQEQTRVYLDSCEKLEKCKLAMEGPETFRFVYTCVLRDNQVYFILDPTPAGDSDGDGVDDKSHLMQPYPDASRELLSTLRSGKITVMNEPKRDQWGTFLSAYAPIKDAAGNVVAAAGVDMELSFYQKQVQAIWRNTLVAMLSSLTLSVTVGIGVWFHQKRLHATMEQLSEATIAAQAANEAKSRFLATMSHEIRTPLNGVIGMTELLLTTSLDAGQRDYAKTVQESGENLLKVINDILDFSKIEAGSLRLDPQPMRVEDLLLGINREFYREAFVKGLRLVVEISKGTPAVIEADPERLRQILVNLVGNAVKFTATGKVILSAAPARLGDEGLGVQIKVTDTGIGISDEQRERIFQPFSQVDSSTTRSHDGSGLGLVICDRLCCAMGSRMEFDSTLGKGSSFYFVLPVAEVAGMERTGEIHSVACGDEALVVCPDRLLRTLLQRLLQKQGWQVSSAESVERAGDCGGFHGLVVFDLFAARGSAQTYAEQVMRALPAARHVAINSGLEDEDQAAVLGTGVSLLLPRNPTLGDLSLLTPCRTREVAMLD